MIRSLLTLLFWVVYTPLAALVAFPWTFISGKVDFLYHAGIWGAGAGVRIAGVCTRTVGLERVDRSRAYIYMANHVSNLDPPVLIPAIPQRCHRKKRPVWRA